MCLSFIVMLFCLEQRWPHFSKKAAEILQFGKNSSQAEMQFLIDENQVTLYYSPQEEMHPFNILSRPFLSPQHFAVA